QIKRDLSQPTRVVEGRYERLGLAQICHAAPKVPRRVERRAQRKPEIDGLLARAARLRQLRERPKRLFEVPHRLTVGRPRQGLLPPPAVNTARPAAADGHG